MINTMSNDTTATNNGLAAPNRITLTPAEFRSIVSIGVAASTNDITAIITGVNISVTAGLLAAVATDRCRVARVEIPLGERIAEDFEITISAKELTAYWGSIKATALKGNSGVELTIHAPENPVSPNMPMRYELAYSGSTKAGEGIYGSYPPVARLMEGYDLSQCDGTPSLLLRPSFLGDLAKIFHPSDDARENLKEIAWEFRFKPSPAEGKIAPPIYATRYAHDRDLIRLDYMLQPNKEVR